MRCNKENPKKCFLKSQACLFILFLLLMLAFSSVSVSADIVGDERYTITSETDLTAEYTNPIKKTCTSAIIPDTVNISSKTYKVTSIAANAFKGCSKLKKVTIGQCIEKIGKNAFYGCKNLKIVTIRTTKLNKASVGSTAFAKINSKAVVTVPQSVLSGYKTILKAKGLNGKGQKVSGKKRINEYESSVPQFDYSAVFWRGGFAFYEGGVDKGLEIGDETDRGIVCGITTGFGVSKNYQKKIQEYTLGDTMEIRSKFTLLPPIYGYWEKDDRRITGHYLQCAACKKYFPTDYMLAEHQEMGLGGHDIGLGNYFIGSTAGKETWAFIADPDPCKMVLEYTLPQGISCKKENIIVGNSQDKEDCTDQCTINVSGGHITVTINDVKQEPFYVKVNTEAYLNTII